MRETEIKVRVAWRGQGWDQASVQEAEAALSDHVAKEAYDKMLSLIDIPERKVVSFEVTMNATDDVMLSLWKREVAAATYFRGERDGGYSDGS